MRIFWPVLAAILVAIAVVMLIVSEKFRAKYLWRIIDLIVGGIFIYAGAIKAFYLPWLEIFCGLALIFRFLYRGGLSILTALITVFIGVTIAAKLRGLDITCGCFGHASEHWSFPQHMAVDLSIFIALAALWFANRHQLAELQRQ